MNQNQFKALNKLRSEVGKMKGMNAKGGFQYPVRAPAETMGDMIHRRRAFSASNKTASPAAAWLANQMDRKDIIGSCASYVGDAHDPTSAHYQHLQKFSGGGLFCLAAGYASCNSVHRVAVIQAPGTRQALAQRQSAQRENQCIQQV